MTSRRPEERRTESPRLRLLLVVPSLDRGGAERVVVNLANGLAACGDEVTVLVTGAASGPSSLAEDLSVDVNLAVLGARRVRSALAGLVRMVRRLRPDVLVTTHTHVNLAVCAIRWMLPRRTRLVLREPIHAPRGLEGRDPRRTRYAQRLLYTRSDAVLASSDALAADLAALTTARIVRLENPVDCDAIRLRAHAWADPRSESRSGRRFVCVARLTPQKELGDLILAFDSASGSDDSLEIIGEGPQRSDLEALVRRLGVAGRVMLPGIVDDHWSRLAQADALVLASHAEGMPNVVLEALALGTPVLATTDLSVLEPLAREVGEHALRLVPRDALPSALQAVPSGSGPFPRPSTLPARFECAAVVDRLREILLDTPDGG